ncbi:MAG: GAF domain-containing protein, partial [Bacteroidales bacterium]|nr:GAF domain-containing protein [Bacteroidales bacterium]
MVSKKNIIIISWSVVGAALVGIILMILVFVFALSILEEPFSLADIKKLHSEFNILYITRLIPIFFAILVGIITQKVLKKLDDKDKLQNSLLTSINDTKKFVNNIEQGNLNSQFKFDNGDKELRLSLESMRKSLLKGDEKERGRNKINLLVSEISNMLRSESNLDELGYNIISYLANNMDGVVQAAFYLVNNQQSDKKLITQIASHAYKRKKILQSEFQFGEGLVGQAAIEKDIILRTEIPEDYPTISSGLLGDKKPESILITPLSLEDEVYGVIELASLRKFNDLQINFLKELSEVIARTIHNIRVNEQTRLLFEESEKMRSELSIQKQQLIENAEKMIQTQDELKDTNSQLEIQIQETKVSTKKSMVLLENSLEVIFIFNPEGMTLFVSPSIKTVLGYFPEEVVGFRNVENLHPLDVERFEKFLDNIKSFPEKDHSLQYRYFTKSGEIIWLEAKGKNSLADEIIKGIV